MREIHDVHFQESRHKQIDAAAAVIHVEQTVAEGNSGLSYDPSAGQYVYIWKTDHS